MVINDLDDWEKVVEEFEQCGGSISDNDARAILLKELPSTTHSSLVSSLRKCPSHFEMKKELDAEVTFLKDFKPDSGSGSAHLAAEQAEALAVEADEDEDKKGVIVFDPPGVSEEKAEVLVMSARSSGLRVKPPFKMAGKKPRARARHFARPACPATPPKTGDARCAKCPYKIQIVRKVVEGGGEGGV